MPDLAEPVSFAEGHTLRLHNTRARTTEPVEPRHTTGDGRPHLRFYGCGPTVYTFAHIGNFRSFLTADLILRTAQALGWHVTYVSNVTDVGHLTQDDLIDAAGEDKMAAALEREGSRFANIYDLARFYTDALLDDWHALNLRDPDVRPRATEHVTDQIRAVQRLEDAGLAYATEQGVYFDVTKDPAYGTLSGNDAAEQLQATGRETVDDPGKRDPRDFALWKIDPDHLMQWHSPWGYGFPGWHIECSVMGRRYLGPDFDLHTGGEDLIFPHHECELAQNRALSAAEGPGAGEGNGAEDAGEAEVRYWVHTRFLQVEGEKMSKSKGNFYTVRDLIAPEEGAPGAPEGGRGVEPLALRYALMAGQYRKPFNFTMQTLKDAAKHVQRYQEAAARVDAVLAEGEPDGAGGGDDGGDGDDAGDDRIGARLADAYERTLAAMCDDLNTPAALAAALDGVKLIQGLAGDGASPGGLNAASAQSARHWLDATNALLGIVAPEHRRPGVASGPHHAPDASADALADEVEALLDERAQARADGDYARADALRDALDAMGIEVMDGPEGTTWRKKVSV
jgi:cysteinyl-tRNA synthetase